MNKRVFALLVTTVTAIAPAASSPRPARAEDAAPLGATFPTEAILGEWTTPAETNRPPGRIKFVRGQDGTYLGIATWSSQPKKDVHNKDPKLRDRPIVGSVIIWHLRYEDGKYVDGYVYNPEDGDTYRFEVEVLTPESLKVRGYLGIPLLGQNQTWARYHAP